MLARRIALSALLGLALATAACSKKEEPAAAGPAAAGELAALLKDAKLVAPGKLTVCSDIPYAPFEFTD